MNYKEINDKWKVFLTENAFKEDIVIKPGKDKNKKKGKKEIIVSEKDDCVKKGSKCMDEWEEFNEQEQPGDTHSFNVNDEEEQEEQESLEEMSAMSGGAVQGYAGNAFSHKKKIKPY